MQDLKMQDQTDVQAMLNVSWRTTISMFMQNHNCSATEGKLTHFITVGTKNARKMPQQNINPKHGWKVWSLFSGVTKGGGRGGQLPPGVADKGGAKQPHQNILTTIKLSLMKFAEWANSSLSQQTLLPFSAIMDEFASTKARLIHL